MALWSTSIYLASSVHSLSSRIFPASHSLLPSGLPISLSEWLQLLSFLSVLLPSNSFFSPLPEWSFPNRKRIPSLILQKGLIAFRIKLKLSVFQSLLGLPLHAQVTPFLCTCHMSMRSTYFLFMYRSKFLWLQTSTTHVVPFAWNVLVFPLPGWSLFLLSSMLPGKLSWFLRPCKVSLFHQHLLLTPIRALTTLCYNCWIAFIKYVFPPNCEPFKGKELSASPVVGIFNIFNI